MHRGRPDNPLEYAPTGKPYQGSAIRQMRQAKKLGLRKLAALISYDSGTLSKAENNQAVVSSEALQKIAKILEVDENELRRLPLHPRLSKQNVGAIGQSATVVQTLALEELKAEVRELKAELAEVKAIAKELISYIRETVPSYLPQPFLHEEIIQPLVEQRPGEDLGIQGVGDRVDSGSGQERTESVAPKFNPIRKSVEEVIEEVKSLRYLEEPHSGRVILTYLVEQDCFGGDRELEAQWLTMFKGVIDKGWDVLDFIWLNDDKERASHIKENLRSLLGGRGDYKVYITKTYPPYRHSVDFVAVDSKYDSLKRAFVYHALEPKLGQGPHHIAEVHAIYPVGNKYIKEIKNILNLLKRWEEGKEGGFKLLSEEERTKFVE